MKKLITLSAVAMFSVPALVQANPGCGFGSQLFEGQEGVVPHVLAATTNGTSGNQTFGMTSGTLGCDTSTPVVAAALFLDNNMDEIAENMAVGEGEALTTLAKLLKVESVEEFNALTQANFDKIFTEDTVTAEQVIANINAVINA